MTSLLVAESGEHITITIARTYLYDGWEKNAHPMVICAFESGGILTKDNQQHLCTSPTILDVHGNTYGALEPADSTSSEQNTTNVELYIAMDASRRAGIGRMKPQATNVFMRAVRDNPNGIMHKGYFYIGTYCGVKSGLQIVDDNTLIVGGAKIVLESEGPVLSFV